MKRMLIAGFLLTLTAGSAYAVTGPTEEDYKNLDQTRAKLVRMKREMDRFIRDLMTTYSPQGDIMPGYFGQDVKVDISETDKDVIVKADLPGMEKDKIDITLENNKILKIAGSREVEKEEKAPGLVKQERMQGRFERVLELPAECVSAGINATYKNGVLEITIPKSKKAQEELVKIKVQ